MLEFDLIKDYFFKISKKNQYALNLNDDVFFDKKKELVVSIDTYNQGNHFLDFKKPGLVIKKIIRSSISDLVCKGVRPKFYFISGSGNSKSFTKDNLSDISRSLNEEQKKFGILLCGGDTTFSNKLSFSITSLGYSKKIIFRNKTKLNDDIYVTGNLGDSFVGLQILKKKINFTKKINKYFISKYFMPEIQISLAKKLLNFANSSIDVSDGLIADLEKLINNQPHSFKLCADKIPISNFLSNLVDNGKLKKYKMISNGDDYQILFTASPSKSRIIDRTSKINSIKITKIGKIIGNDQKSSIINQKGEEILIKNKGYIHNF